MSDYFIWILLFVAGAFAFSISALTAGGGALMLVPILNFLIGTTSTAPVLNTGNLFGRPVRLVLYWKHIQWKAVLWYSPFALIGALSAGYFFTQANLTLLQVIVGLFLISTVFQFQWGKKERSFPMSFPLLAPLGLIISAIGTLIGAGGPLLNPFYLNLGITKEELIATKTANSFIMGLAQIGSYTYFGLMNMTEWHYAVALGLGIACGNFFGKKLLKKISDKSFRQWAIGFMVLSGAILLLKAIMSLIDGH
ncbi:MAG: sulfite exporter TauE/SafE family protein [Marinoscillum sp.]